MCETARSAAAGNADVSDGRGMDTRLVIECRAPISHGCPCCNDARIRIMSPMRVMAARRSAYVSAGVCFLISLPIWASGHQRKASIDSLMLLAIIPPKTAAGPHVNNKPEIVVLVTSNVYAAPAAVLAERDPATLALHLRRRAADRSPCRGKRRRARIPAAARGCRRGASSISPDGSQALRRQVPEAAALAPRARRRDPSSPCASPGRLSRRHAFCNCPFPAPGRHVENLRRDAAAPQRSAASARGRDYRHRGRELPWRHRRAEADVWWRRHRSAFLKRSCGRDPALAHVRQRGFSRLPAHTCFHVSAQRFNCVARIVRIGSATDEAFPRRLAGVFAYRPQPVSALCTTRSSRSLGGGMFGLLVASRKRLPRIGNVMPFPARHGNLDSRRLLRILYDWSARSAVQLSLAV